MINIVKVKRICIACPSDFDGETDDGRYFYMRYRGGMLRAGIAKNHRCFWTAKKWPYLYEKKVGRDLDGWMGFSEFKQHLSKIFNFDKCDYVDKYEE